MDLHERAPLLRTARAPQSRALQPPPRALGLGVTGFKSDSFLEYVKLVKQFYQTGEARLADWDVPKEAE